MRIATRPLCWITWGILLTCLLAQPPLGFANEGRWKVIHQEEELVISEREDAGSSLVTFKGEGVLDAPLVRVAGVILNHDRAPEWVDNLEDIKILKFVTPTDYFEYSHIGTPIIVKDRDFVVRTRLDYDAAAGRLTIRSRSTDEPVMPPTKYVRGQVEFMNFDLKSEENGAKTRLAAELRVDPKGNIPKWLVNLFQRNWPKRAFYGIKRELKRPEYRFPEAFRGVFGVSG